MLDKTVNSEEKINTKFLVSGVYLIVVYKSNRKLFGAKIVKP